MNLSPKEYKLVALRECLPHDAQFLCEEPGQAFSYWQANIPANPYFQATVENLVVLLVNTRRRLMGHVVISTGTLDTCLVHAREVFRPAIVANAAAIILMHNHPSGDPSPSEADIKITRDLIRAGELLKIQVLDHVVVGNRAEPAKSYVSLRELGYFCT